VIAALRAVHGQGIDLVVGIESRGFILGGAVADRLGAGFVRSASRESFRRRPPGKATRSSTAPTRSKCTRTPVTKGQNVLIVDDVIATGGTAKPRARSSVASGARARAGVSDRARVPERTQQLGGEQIFSVLQY
jgi:adenine phosphoribosyltransferase